MTTLPLSLRLATRQLAGNRASTVLSAIAISIPTTALIVAQIVTSNSVPVYADDVAPLDRVFLAMMAATSFAIPVAFVITVMVGAAVMVSARRHERMLALLESIGAPPAVLFRVVSATGLVIGVLSALFSIVAGLVIGYLWLGPAASRTSDAQINPLAVIGIALVSVLLGWATSIIPAIRATSLDLNRVLRGTPKPVSGRWATGRVGRILMTVGLGMLLLAGAATLAIRTFYEGGYRPGFFSGFALGAIISGLTQLGPLLLIVGLLLNLPGAFRAIGRLLARFGTAPRLAARDAERNWGRSVPAAAAIMVAAFVIGSYLTSFGASAASNVQNHFWSLQQGQVSVGLIDPGYNAVGAALDPKPVADPEAIENALRSNLALAQVRILGGVQGPFYGAPVDDNEGYSGRQPMVFPPGGLPHPETAKDGPCSQPATAEVPAWRCSTNILYASLAFPLSPNRPNIWVGNADDLKLMLGGTVDSATRAAFSAGDAIVFDARYLAGDDTVTISWYGDTFVPEDEPDEFLPAGPPLRSTTVSARVVPLEHRLGYGVFLSDAHAAELGLTVQPSLVLGQLAGTPTQQEQNAASEAIMTAAQSVTGTSDPWLTTEFELGPSQPDYAWSWGALLLALGVTLAISITAVGLARVEGRETDRTLDALGAAPGIRRRMSGWYALIVVGYATVSGTLIGILPAYLGMFAWVGTGSPLVIPLFELGLLAVAVPLVVAAVAWLTPARSATAQRNAFPA